MARCGCADPDIVAGMCNCVVEAGPSGLITVTGTGQALDPYQIDVDPDLGANALTVDPGEGLTITGTGTLADPWSIGTVSGFFSRGFQSMQVYTANNNFVKAAFPLARFIRVRCVGGGGGGAGATSGAGVGVPRGGGSGGSYAESWLDVSALAASVPITVGAAGAAGAAANGAGGNGGNSSFGALVIGTGGVGSDAAIASAGGFRVAKGAPVGVASTGQVTAYGQPGETGNQASPGNGQGGNGGAAGGGMGAGGRGGTVIGATGEVGEAASLYGGGGGGAIAGNTSAFAGGAGAAGVVIVEIFG